MKIVLDEDILPTYSCDMLDFFVVWSSTLILLWLIQEAPCFNWAKSKAIIRSQKPPISRSLHYWEGHIIHLNVTLIRFMLLPALCTQSSGISPRDCHPPELGLRLDFKWHFHTIWPYFLPVSREHICRKFEYICQLSDRKAAADCFHQTVKRRNRQVEGGC